MILPIVLGFAPLCLEGSSASDHRSWAAQTFDYPSSGRVRGGCLGRSDLVIGSGGPHGHLVDHLVDCTFDYHAHHSDFREGSLLDFHEDFRFACLISCLVEGSCALGRFLVKRTSFYHSSGLGAYQ